jgi:hypothetical protein
LKEINKYFILLFFTLLTFYGCFNNISKHRNFINMLLEYYPEHRIEIIESDPNKLIINIFKGDK